MEARSLLRAFLREARAFPDYNLAAYVKRRAVQGFRENRALKGEQAQAALSEGRAQLEVVRRQKVVRGLYQDRMPSVMELGKKAPGAAR